MFSAKRGCRVVLDKHRELCCLLTSRRRVVQRVKVTLDRKFVANIGL